MTAYYELTINSGDGGNITIPAQPFHDVLAAHNERPSPNWKERAKQLSQFVGFEVEDWQMVEASSPLFDDEDGNYDGSVEYGR